ncbi:MAG TPA: kynureninase, partial [Gemmatimonadaceae bacterium]|nr:kynureninase [Gemmatimonadaceae bacterium]
PIKQALIDRGVIGDFRAPDILRLGFTPLYLGYAELWDAVATLKDIMAERAWDRAEYHARSLVT